MRNYCIYFLIDNGEVVYIGQTGQLKIRLRQHSDKSYSSVRFIPCDKESLNYYESRWINRFKPRYNGPAIPCKRKAIEGNGASRNVYFKNPELWDFIAKAAADQNRSVNNYIETILAAHLLNESLKK